MDQQQLDRLAAESTIISDRHTRSVYVSTRTGTLQRQMHSIDDALRALVHNRHPDLPGALARIASARATLDLMEREARALAAAWAAHGGEPDD